MSFISLTPSSSRLQVILHAVWAFLSTQISQLIDPGFVNLCHRAPVPAIEGWKADHYVGKWYEQAHVIEFDVF